MASKALRGVTPPAPEETITITQGELRSMDLDQLLELLTRLGLDTESIRNRSEAITAVISCVTHLQ